MDEGAASVVVEQQEATLTAPFDGLVRRCSGFRREGLEAGVHIVGASAHIKLIVGVGPDFDYEAMSDGRQPPAAFRTFVVGPHVTPAAVRHDGAQSAVEVEIPPICLRSLVGISAGDLGARVVELEDLIGRPALRLGDAVRNAPTWEDRFRAVEFFVSERRSDARVQPEVEFAWQRVCASNGRVSVSSLGEAVGWSERHLLRRFRAETGLTPKVASRITRFERAETLLARSAEVRLSDIAAECGYFDQSHLAAEWQALAGSPLKAFRDRV